jgi:hypothetical protein
MDLLIAEMEKLLNLDKEKCDIQGITGKNIFYFTPKKFYYLLIIINYFQVVYN